MCVFADVYMSPKATGTGKKMIFCTVAVCVDRSCSCTKMPRTFVYFVLLVHFVLVDRYRNELLRSRKNDTCTRKEQLISIRNPLSTRVYVVAYE